MPHKFINQIQAGQTIDDVYIIKEPILRSTSRGDLYIAMYLADKTGQLNGRMWQASEGIYNELPKPGFVHIQGRSELYQNTLQIVINNISVVDAGKVSLEDFLARTTKDVGKMFEEVKQIVGTIKNPHLKALADEFLADKELMERFCSAPGGMKLHHSCLGGLLEHTHNMLKVALAVMPFYPKVQHDLVVAGIFLHDIGKTDELNFDMTFSYTDTGQLIGHIVQSVILVNKKAGNLAAKGTPVDKTVLDSLNHIILAHHGEYEYGSPKIPATSEAFVVNYIDDLDAKLNQVETAIENETSDTDWTAWQNALQTKIYRKRI